MRGMCVKEEGTASGTRLMIRPKQERRRLDIKQMPKSRYIVRALLLKEVTCSEERDRSSYGKSNATC